MKQNYIVKQYHYMQDSEITKDINIHVEQGYYPREIKLSTYQDTVERLVVFELRE